MSLNRPCKEVADVQCGLFWTGTLRLVVKPDYLLGGLSTNLKTTSRRELYPAGEVFQKHLQRLFGSVQYWSDNAVIHNLIRDFGEKGR